MSTHNNEAIGADTLKYLTQLTELGLTIPLTTADSFFFLDKNCIYLDTNVFMGDFSDATLPSASMEQVQVMRSFTTSTSDEKLHIM